ncbi:MAG: hypothetical protein K6T66_01405 [Peptococcaceae bacterium]|nr:hypothetical protein [Peptococcaceae bacterium]
MNDIWALPSGEWVVYSDEEAVIRDFLSLADLEVVTSYHGMFKKHRAVQFKFAGREELLRYVCFMAGFDYGQAVKLLKRPGISYNRLFGDSAHQPPLFIETEPRRKKAR